MAWDDKRRAIYIPFAQAVPKVATIDRIIAPSSRQASAACVKVCTAGAIDYTQKDELIEQKYGAIVVATGYTPLGSVRIAMRRARTAPPRWNLQRIMNGSRPTNEPVKRLSDRQAPAHAGVRAVRGQPR